LEENLNEVLYSDVQNAKKRIKKVRNIMIKNLKGGIKCGQFRRGT
jgi:hypothetical protein